MKLMEADTGKLMRHQLGQVWGLIKTYARLAVREVQYWAQPILHGRLQDGQPMPQESREVLDAIRQPVRFGVKVSIVVALVLFLWGGVAPLDSASISSGSVVMDSSRKTVQHLEGGVITEILVKDGDHVKEGQVLLRLNPATVKAKHDTIEGRLISARVAEGRLLAEKQGASSFDPVETVKAAGLKYDAQDAELQKIVEAQSTLFKTRRKDYTGQLEVLNQRVAQNRDIIDGLNAQKEAAEKQLKLIDEELATLQELVKKGLAVRSKLLDTQREKAMLEGSIGNFVSGIANTQEKIGETETQKINVESVYQKEVASELKDVQQEIADLSEQFAASSDIYRRTEITAPLSGEVTGLKFHTIGGVITPGAAIMDIVSDKDTMVIETRIPPQDIDVVHNGSRAKVRLTAYRNRFLPRMEGTLVYVSADKFTDERTMTSYYIGRVRIDEDEIKRYRDEFSMYPGMPAEVFIVTGSHTLISYLMYPLLGMFQRGMSED